MSDKSGSAPGRLLLKDLIDQVRGELVEAVAARRKTPGAPEFVVEDITLEVNFVVDTSEKLSGEAKASLFAVGLKADAEKTYRTEQVHKVSLKLTVFDGEKPGAGDTKRAPWLVHKDFDGSYVGVMGSGEEVSYDSSIGKIRVDPIDILGNLPSKKMTLNSLNEQLQSKGYCLMPSQHRSKPWLKKK